MEQPLPQFLNIEPKVAGPFTFKQLLFIAGIGIIILILFTLMPIGTFIILAIPLAGLALFLAFGRIKGFPAPTVLARSFSFLFTNKVYVWRKKGGETITELPHTIKRAEEPKTKVEPSLKIAGNSKLKKLGNLIQIRR